MAAAETREQEEEKLWATAAKVCERALLLYCMTAEGVVPASFFFFPSSGFFWDRRRRRRKTSAWFITYSFLRARWLTSLTPLRLFFVFFFFFYFLLFERRRFLEIWLAPGLFFLSFFFSRSDRNRNRQIYDFSHYHRLVFFFFFFPSSTVSPHMATDGRNFEKKKNKNTKIIFFGPKHLPRLMSPAFRGGYACLKGACWLSL